MISMRSYNIMFYFNLQVITYVGTLWCAHSLWRKIYDPMRYGAGTYDSTGITFIIM